MSVSRSKPLLIYDGDCGFCRFFVFDWLRRTGGRIDAAPFQEAAAEHPEIPLEEFWRSVKLIETDGSVSSAAEAVFRVLGYAPGYGWLIWFYRHVPGVAPVSDWAYRLVADHRNFFSRILALVWGRTAGPRSHFLTRWIFLRLLGLVYLFAFASLYPQILGLVGSHGILPAHHFMAVVARDFGARRYRLFPSLTWFDSSDAFLRFLAGGGAALSMLLILGVAPGPVLVVLWVFYASLVTAGQGFLSFQWDALLLEAGFLAIFFAPWQLLEPHWKRADASQAAPSIALVWLLRWLLFRLVFLSGCVKLLSHDPTWRNLTALDYHYETQPLPTPLAWYAFQLPRWFQKFSTGCVFFIELFVPFLIFAPRRVRLLGCGVLVGFQILIAATGNYAFFNLLAVTLCVLLLDDQAVRGALPAPLVRRLLPDGPVRQRSRARKTALAAFTFGMVLATGSMTWSALAGPRATPRPVIKLAHWIEPMRIVSNYGLFAVMTTSRPEIIIQGSDDGIAWQDYVFKYQPVRLNEAPRWVAPYQPRLDWQMWFAALSNYQMNPWFVNLMVRLLEGSPEVLRLFARNPFPGAPPRYIRAVVYDYHFTHFSERHATGDWWQRKLEGNYFPIAGFRRP